MITPSSGIDQYFAAVAALQRHVLDTQREQLHHVATVMTEVIMQDGRIFVFGTGHSHLLAEEGHYRAGGLANVVPILSSALMVHESATVSVQLERLPGLARALCARYQLQSGEMMFIFSNSGVNAVPVEMALLAKERQLTTVAVCALSYARLAPLSALGKRLPDVVDYVIDNGGQPGDSLIQVDGSPWRVGSSSTVMGAVIWNALITEVAFQLQARSMDLPVYASSNVAGAAEHNAPLLEKWRARNPHM
jgi:uncharacterized phosphosugar-binding protein